MVEAVGKVWRLRCFWLLLVKYDLLMRYRRSVLGIGWSLVHPIAMTVVLCTVFHKLFHVDVRDFAPKLLAGLAFWGFVTASVQQGCWAFRNAETYIRQHPVPLTIYPLRVVLGAAFHLIMALGVVVVLTWCFCGAGNPLAMLALLPSLLLLLAFGWALATLAAFANTYFPDTQYLSEVGLQVLFYMTPILYPPGILKERGLAWLIDYNPLACLLELIRDPIFVGQIPTMGVIGGAAATTAVLVLAATLTLGRLHKQLVFHL
jgi:lipopolysaccharide transport system permease protein